MPKKATVKKVKTIAAAKPVGPRVAARLAAERKTTYRKRALKAWGTRRANSLKRSGGRGK